MMEVEVYIMGASFLLRSTSTSICFCIQTSRATFTSLHTLHIKPKPIIDQSPPSSPPSPPQKFDTAPTSPISAAKMATTAQALSDLQDAINKATKNIPTNCFYARVSVSCAEPGCESHTSGHEIVKFENVKCWAELTKTIEDTFKRIQKGNAKVRSNLRHCVWTQDHKLDMVKVNWTGLPGNGWNDNGETYITDANCEDVLAMLIDRRSMDSLNITISPRS
ncbi:hypothetical protein DL98DRAFT_588263 [Cadophora sp. DSE1049]|nr:hypothetical protein DL98DRAFT_588263 [Cadophora sp. DSE1049]